MTRATTSFPTPDSPCRHVVVSVAATWIALFRTARQAGDWPTAATGEADVVDQRVETWFARGPFHLAICNCCMVSPAAHA